MAGFGHDYWYPGSSLVHCPRLIDRSLFLDGDRQIILVGSGTILGKHQKLHKEGEGGLASNSFCPDVYKEKRCGCNNMERSRVSYGPTRRRSSSADIKVMDELPPPVVEKLKDITAKKKYSKMTLGKTYSTYAIKFSFRKVYPDLDFDCKFNRRIPTRASDLPEEEVTEKKRKPRPRTFIRSPPKLSGSRQMNQASTTPRRSRASSHSAVVLRLMPDFTTIDIFDKKLNQQDATSGKRKRFTMISKKMMNFQQTHNLIENFANPESSLQKQQQQGSLLLQPKPKTIHVGAERIEEQRRLESELRRMKRRSRKTAVVVETKIEVVHVKSDEEKKNERDEILVKLCMANPKWSHVIHYHNKITKHGIKLDLDTLLHGMLLPNDYRELQENCYEELLVIEAIEKAKKELDKAMAAAAAAAALI